MQLSRLAGTFNTIMHPIFVPERKKWILFHDGDLLPLATSA
jgi:hypothetical protein